MRSTVFDQGDDLRRIDAIQAVEMAKWAFSLETGAAGQGSPQSVCRWMQRWRIGIG